MPDLEDQPSLSPTNTPRRDSDRKRILIVDDSSGVRGIVREGLELQVGCACEEASNGVEAIQKAKKFMPDLVVLDLAMPTLNGFEVATVMQRELPKIPIVILTMYAEELGRSLANSVGVKAVVSKADGIGTLIDCVRNLLAVK
jgi:CheY-like chemotaxis protein